MSIKIENTEVVGWDHAIRGMRNPKNSWEKSDSGSCTSWECSECGYYKLDPNFSCGDRDDYLIGPNDHQLMMSLAKGGPVHAKYRRMITVYVDITAPLYWWKEFDTYKVGTVANSCSTMHKISAKEFELSDFSHEHLSDEDYMYGDDADYDYDLAYTYLHVLEHTIFALNRARDKYLETLRKPMKDNTKRAALAKKYWWQMIQLLPSSYNQKRTVMLNYEVLANMYESRKNHKLDEWHTLCDWIESLPYSELIIMEYDTREGTRSGPEPWSGKNIGPYGIVRTQAEIEADRKN